LWKDRTDEEEQFRKSRLSGFCVSRGRAARPLRSVGATGSAGDLVRLEVEAGGLDVSEVKRLRSTGKKLLIRIP
jgi:hypothetical protein